MMALSKARVSVCHRNLRRLSQAGQMKVAKGVMTQRHPAPSRSEASPGKRALWRAAVIDGDAYRQGTRALHLRH
ncbi:hypothetical protein GN956_G3697 [Arapaima gigas]